MTTIATLPYPVIAHPWRRLLGVVNYRQFAGRNLTMLLANCRKPL